MDSAAGAAGRMNVATARVLIVDDDAATRLALTAILSPLELVIVQASTGMEALRCVLTDDFAVILMDVRMPGMDGFETAALIRQRRQSEMTPIIFVTAHDRNELAVADHYAQGAVDFIYAPVSPHELRAKVSVFANLFTKSAELAERAQALQASADRFRLLADAAPIGIFQTDADNRYLYTNPRWSVVTGIAAEDALGAVWGSITKPISADGVTVELADTDEAGAGHRVETNLGGGPTRTLVATSTIVPDGSGGMSGRVGVVADVTTEVEIEAALKDARDRATEASELKSDFLANMSHEIRTPMNGVIGMTDLLLETELDPVQRDYAQTVRNSGEALLTIINDILDFSKIEAGKIDVEAVDFGVGAIVDDVVHLLRSTAHAKGFELEATVDPEVPAWVRGDPGRLRQVLTNLVGNSVKFTQTGEVAVRVFYNRCGPTNGVLRFEVVDTGVGIAPEKLSSVFLPFVQADSSTSRKYGGTGLGLAISGRLVGLMGGDCGVDSELGVGSAFWFTVRIETAHAPPVALAAPVPSSALRAPNDASHQQGRLLLAEDNAVNEKVAVAMLTGAGYKVDAVRDGAAAVALIAAHHYDAVLMDCQMPELNGYEATALIRTNETANEHIPIIAMTAGARREDRDRCMAAGMDDYISKPVSKDALLAVVAQWLNRSEASSQLLAQQ